MITFVTHNANPMRTTAHINIQEIQKKGWALDANLVLTDANQDTRDIFGDVVHSLEKF